MEIDILVRLIWVAARLGKTRFMLIMVEDVYVVLPRRKELFTCVHVTDFSPGEAYFSAGENHFSPGDPGSNFLPMRRKRSSRATSPMLVLMLDVTA